MKILIIIGSSKVGGNTEQLAHSFEKGAKENGHQVIVVHLGKTKVNPCLGCNSCRQNGHCVQNDDFYEVSDSFQHCDMVVFTTPLYFWQISAQLKAVIDRMYALGEESEKGYYQYPVKKCAMMVTAADSDRHFWTFECVEQYYHRLVRYMGWTNLGMLTAGGCGGTKVDRSIENTEYLRRAYEFGKQLD